GRVLGEAAPPDQYDEVRLSPDGSHVAVRLMLGGSPLGDLWIRDLVRGINSRFTFGTFDNVWPTWSPDGRRIAYCSSRGGEYRVRIRSASGTGAEDSLAHEAGGNDGPTDWSRDGRTIALTRLGSSGWDVWLQGADGKAAANRLFQTPFNERFARFSPDGR